MGKRHLRLNTSTGPPFPRSAPSPSSTSAGGGLLRGQAAQISDLEDAGYVLHF
jgi:hypothetical protein